MTATNDVSSLTDSVATTKRAISFTLNGKPVIGQVEPRTLLVHHLRDDQFATGAHVGCDTSQCGACAVHVNGKVVKSCTVLAVQVDGADVTTIEGVTGSCADGLHPVQQALREKHGLQCGFCTPGMVMTALELLAPGEPLSDEEVRHGLEGNMCRCTGYQNIVDALVDLSQNGVSNG